MGGCSFKESKPENIVKSALVLKLQKTKGESRKGTQVPQDDPKGMNRVRIVNKIRKRGGADRRAPVHEVR
jgi:hypothetical protein